MIDSTEGLVIDCGESRWSKRCSPYDVVAGVYGDDGDWEVHFDCESICDEFSCVFGPFEDKKKAEAFAKKIIEKWVFRSQY